MAICMTATRIQFAVEVHKLLTAWHLNTSQLPLVQSAPIIRQLQELHQWKTFVSWRLCTSLEQSSHSYLPARLDIRGVLAVTEDTFSWRLQWLITYAFSAPTINILLTYLFFLFNWPSFRKLLQVGQSTKKRTFGDDWSRLQRWDALRRSKYWMKLKELAH